MAETRSTCPYCGVGCGVIIETEAGAITGVRGDPDHPANFGRLCSKGSTLHLTATARGDAADAAAAAAAARRARRRAAADRLGRGARPRRRPLRRDDRARTAPTRSAFYISGQLLTEDYYVFNKLAKGLIGTNNVDTNSRLCMSSAVAGYKATLGADAPPCCYDDLDARGDAVHRRLEHRVRASDPVSPHRGRARARTRR